MPTFDIIGRSPWSDEIELYGEVEDDARDLGDIWSVDCKKTKIEAVSFLSEHLF